MKVQKASLKNERHKNHKAETDKAAQNVKKTNEYKSKNNSHQNQFVLPSHKLGHFESIDGSYDQQFSVKTKNWIPQKIRKVYIKKNRWLIVQFGINKIDFTISNKPVSQS